jgi:hypothetical protein
MAEILNQTGMMMSVKAVYSVVVAMAVQAQFFAHLQNKWQLICH